MAFLIWLTEVISLSLERVPTPFCVLEAEIERLEVLEEELEESDEELPPEDESEEESDEESPEEEPVEPTEM